MTARRVFINGGHSDQESSQAEHSYVDFVLVDADRVHVWFNETHYIGAGEVDSVEEGDLFYDLGQMFEYVYEIVDKYESVEGATQVEVDFHYPPDKDSMKCGENNVLYGSPTLLTDSGYTLLDSPELARVRESSER